MRPLTLDVTEDDRAAIVRGETRYEITGPHAAAIIAAYRHLLTHKDTGELDAAIYLWGVTAGLRYLHQTQMAELMNKYRKARAAGA